jgi:1-acylglycerone phosphate reductase
MNPKTALITGCSAGGVGDALARSFHRNGVRVFATARDLSKTADLEALEMEVIQIDVVDPDSVRKAVDVIRKVTGGSFDILIMPALVRHRVCLGRGVFNSFFVPKYN